MRARSCLLLVWPGFACLSRLQVVCVTAVSACVPLSAACTGVVVVATILGGASTSDSRAAPSFTFIASATLYVDASAPVGSDATCALNAPSSPCRTLAGAMQRFRFAISDAWGSEEQCQP